MPHRPPRQLLLALLGDHVLDRADRPVRAAAIIAALEGAGVAEATTRASLARLVRQGILVSEKRGREIDFRLTAAGVALLSEGDERVRGDRPFDSHGGGWTLVTFSIPEGRRALRHRVRSTLTWQGFAPLRDGLWLAPGAVDLRRSLLPLSGELDEGAMVAFRARELEDFPIAASVRQAWDIDAIRAAHVGFARTWTGVDAAAVAARGGELVARTELVADWLTLLGTDPGLPPEYMEDDWPAAASVRLYRRLRDELEAGAAAGFAELAGVETALTE